MKDNNQPYKRSIWDFDKRYSIELGSLSGDALRKIGLVQSVESAKKRTPPIPVAYIINLVNVIEKLPPSSRISVQQFKKCLEEIDCWGADIKTSICILSVLKNGQYPPLDWRIAKTARKKNVIDDKEEQSLNGKNKEKIAKIYIEKLLPLWRKELDKVKDPKSLDNNWGQFANGS